MGFVNVILIIMRNRIYLVHEYKHALRPNMTKLFVPLHEAVKDGRLVKSLVSWYQGMEKSVEFVLLISFMYELICFAIGHCVGIKVGKYGKT